MNFLDILLILVIAVFTLRGLLRGVVKEVFTLAAVVAGFFLANTYHTLPAPFLEKFISGTTNLNAAGYFLIFVGTLVAAFILYKLVSMAVTFSLAKWLDYSTGALFGLLEGCVVTAFLVLLLMNFMPETEFIKKSKLIPRINEATAYAVTHSPKQIRTMIDQTGLNLPKLPEKSEFDPSDDIADAPLPDQGAEPGE